MRTTLDVDEDVLEAVKSLASTRRTTAGKILSDLARQALMPPTDKATGERTRNGVPLFNFPSKPGDKLVTMELVNRLRDEDE